MKEGGLVACALVVAGCGFKADPHTVDPDARTDSGSCTLAWGYAPSNFTPCAGATPSPALSLDNGMFELTPQTGAVTKGGAPFAMLMTAGVSPRVVAVDSLTITATATLRILGPDPTIIVVHGNATIDGIVTVSAMGTIAGAGADACAAMYGSNADGSLVKSAGGGGAGGAFGTGGAAGGTGDTSATPTPGGTAMSPQGSAMLVPLRGGCRGGPGGQEHQTANATPGGGGGAGGAIQFSVRDMLTVGTSARLQSNGGGGRLATNISNGTGTHAGAGGGGGGAGGAIFLEARMMTILPGAILCANGGGGGGGSHDTTDGADGSNGACAAVKAPGGVGNGTGGDGAFASTNATPGVAGGGQDGGGGGGGGGAGRIRVRTAMGPKPAGFVSTPPALID